MSLPVRGAWIEISYCAANRSKVPSLPVRGAWIEIQRHSHVSTSIRVAPRAGSVD